MTETEKQRKRDLKAQAAEWLSNLPKRLQYDRKLYEATYGTDPRIADYLTEVSQQPQRHNLYELLSAVRFVELVHRHEWSPGRVQRFFKLYEALRFSGTMGRTRYRLTPVQCFQFGSIFGHSLADGRRLIRTAILFVPRKYSKTTSAAALAVNELLFGDNNAQAYVGANSYQQAKICFDEIRNIMFDIDPHGRHFRINREKITYNDHSRQSLVECLTANAKTKDGLFASLVIMDEYAQARNTAGKNGADLRNVLTTSMGPRREPLTLIITTASEVVDGPFAHELEGVKAVLEATECLTQAKASNDTLFASLFLPDVDDDEGDPLTWAKVQPHMGITVQPDFYENEWQSAQLSAENRLAFRTKLLNIFTLSDERTWFNYEVARNLLRPDFDIDRVQGRPSAAVAYDLSVHDDFSAVSYTLYDAQSKSFACHTDYYFPSGALPGHPNEQLYRSWHADGYLILTEGDRIDVRQIANDILRRASTLNIIRIGYDAYKAQDLTNMLRARGGKTALQPYSQTYGSFNLPVESFEMLAYEKPPRIGFNNNPINAYCLSNCVIATDTLENKKPLKASQYRKIDGTITMLMTLGLLYSYEH